jgi:hypothetical protein
MICCLGLPWYANVPGRYNSRLDVELADNKERLQLVALAEMVADFFCKSML